MLLRKFVSKSTMTSIGFGSKDVDEDELAEAINPRIIDLGKLRTSISITPLDSINHFFSSLLAEKSMYNIAGESHDNYLLSKTGFGFIHVVQNKVVHISRKFCKIKFHPKLHKKLSIVTSSSLFG